MDQVVNGAAQPPRRLVVGISGASGVIYGARVLDALNELGVESHLVITRAALLTLSQETDLSPDDLTAKASVVHRLNDVGATIASGSQPWPASPRRWFPTAHRWSRSRPSPAPRLRRWPACCEPGLAGPRSGLLPTVCWDRQAPSHGARLTRR